MLGSNIVKVEEPGDENKGYIYIKSHERVQRSNKQGQTGLCWEYHPNYDACFHENDKMLRN